MFHIIEKEINEHVHLTMIDIPQIDEELYELLNRNLVLICEGNSDGDINCVKKDLIQLFENKTFDWKMGAIAEFFIHLYIRTLDYKQEFLYRNLEEDSIKKGFDGLFSRNNDFWLVESKSGSINTQGISHKSKVKEAMIDLTNKVAGIGQTNNPWKNAYNHASHMDVKASDSLRKDLKALGGKFTLGEYGNINDFNTIPCGTIFLNGIWKDSDSKKIVQDITNLSSILRGKNVFVICITQNTIDMFLDYINKQES